MSPRVIVNCACSADGKLASKERRQVRISGEADMRRVHLIRASVDAVLVGIGTVLADDPKLNVKKRYAADGGEPARVVLDPRGRTPPDASVLGPGGHTYVAVLEMDEDSGRFARLNSLKEAGAEVIFCCDGPTREPGPGMDLGNLLTQLGERGLNTIMVEGGGNTIWSFLKSGLVDELHIFHGSMIIGGSEAPTVADGEGFTADEGFLELELSSVEPLDDGYLASYARKGAA